MIRQSMGVAVLTAGLMFSPAMVNGQDSGGSDGGGGGGSLPTTPGTPSGPLPGGPGGGTQPGGPGSGAGGTRPGDVGGGTRPGGVGGGTQPGDLGGVDPRGGRLLAPPGDGPGGGGPVPPDDGDDDNGSDGGFGGSVFFGGSDYGLHDSTAYGSYARGYADVVRSYGQNHLLNSLAARNLTKARNEQIENRYKYAKNYFEMREMNRAYRAQLRGPRATEAQLIRYAQAGAPDPLTAEQLDPYTGRITWPTLLMADAFAQQRQLIEQIFSNRVLNSGRIRADDYLIMQQSIDQMLAMLQEHIEQFDANDYLQAKNFLESLDYEATS